MAKQEELQYESDRFGNENRKIDRLRAQEGMDDSGDEGIVQITTANTGSVVLIQSKPSRATEMRLDFIHAFNSNPSSGDVFSIFEAQLDGNNSITSSTRRRVPLQVGSGQTQQYDYKGDPFENAIAVESDFEGRIGVAYFSDHRKSDEQPEGPA